MGLENLRRESLCHHEDSMNLYEHGPINMTLR